jgi:predicted dinucleotide-utilizing enzyme
MPHFYLSVRSVSTSVEDLEGADFADLEAARQEARDGIRSIVADALFSGREVLVRSVDITDDRGLMLERVTLAEALSQVIPVDEAFVRELQSYQPPGSQK